MNEIQDLLLDAVVNRGLDLTTRDGRRELTIAIVTLFEEEAWLSEEGLIVLCGR
jgi:hypothetical protein